MTNEEFKNKLEASLKECQSWEDRARIERALRIINIGGIEARRLRRDWERRSGHRRSGRIEYKEGDV